MRTLPQLPRGQTAQREMFSLMSNGGKIALLGIPTGKTEIDWSGIIFKGLTLKGIYGREMFETWYKMAAMVLTGLDISRIITHEFNINDYQQAFDTMRSGNSGKILLHWD